MAAILEGERVLVTGRARGSAPDVVHDRISVEVKSRKILPGWISPGWIRDALRQAGSAVGEGQIPLAVLHQDGGPYADALAVVRLEELAELLRECDAAA